MTYDAVGSAIVAMVFIVGFLLLLPAVWAGIDYYRNRNKRDGKG
jgi:hypothetical protein